MQMQKKMNKCLLAVLLVCMTLILCGCKQNPPEGKLYAKLIGHFAKYGYTCGFTAVDEQRQVPIYKAEAWKSMILDGEEVLVYFDESNRADYLADGIERADYSFVGRFGLRFVLVYEGNDAKVLEALGAMPE